MFKLERLIKIGFYLALCLPFAFTSRTMYPWHFGKTVLFQILVEILLILGLIDLLLRKSKFFKKKLVLNNVDIKVQLFKLCWFDILVLLFIGMQLVSVLLGVNPERSFWGTEQRVQGLFTWTHFVLFYYLLRIYIRTKKEWLNFGFAFVLIAGLSSVVAIFGHNFSFLRGIVLETSRVSGLLGNPIFLAGYLIIPLFICLALIIKTNKIKQKILILNFILILVAIIMTQTRGAYVGVIVGFIAMFVLYVKYGLSGFIKRNISIVVTVILLLFSAIYVFNIKSNYLLENYSKISHAIDINPSSTTASTRLLSWQVALEGWREKPFFGWGLENFQDLFDNNYKADFLDYGFGETVWDKPHNNLVEVLSESGVIGLILYLTIIIYGLKILLNYIIQIENDKSKITYIAVFAALVSFEVQNFFSFFTSDSLLVWIVILAFIGQISKKKSKYNLNKLLEFNGLKNIYFGGAVLIIIACMYFINTNISIFKTSVVMADARDWAEVGSVYQWKKHVELSLENGGIYDWERAVLVIRDLSFLSNNGILSTEILKDIHKDLENILVQEIKKNPQSYMLRFWLSQFYVLMGEYVDIKFIDKSNQLLKEAGGISIERQQVPLHLSKNYLITGEKEKSISILRDLVLKNKGRPESHWFHGISLINNNQIQEGVDELEKGIEFGMDSKQNALYLIDNYAKLERFESIVKIYIELIKKEPDNDQFYASLAATYAALNDFDNMRKNLEKAVELNPALKEEAEIFMQNNLIN